MSISRVLKYVAVLRLEVSELTWSTRAPCEGDGNGGGYFQTYELSKCYRAMQESNRQYNWALRIRTDSLIDIRITSLPPRMSLPNVAFVQSLGNCDCGWSATWPCERKSRCATAGDSFAVLHGTHAIRGYFDGFGREFCTKRTLVGSSVYRSYLVDRRAENRLGYALNAHDIPMRDIRFIHAPIVQIHRGACTRVVQRNLHPSVPTESWESIPSGPWDQRRYAACASARAHNSSPCLTGHDDENYPTGTCPPGQQRRIGPCSRKFRSSRVNVP